jgi:hypothetical protein
MAFPVPNNAAVDDFHRGRLPRQRPARRASGLPRGLLRCLRARSGRQ